MLPTTSQEHVPDHIISSSLNLLQAPPNTPQAQARSPVVNNINNDNGVESFFATLGADELKTCCSSIMTVFHEHCDRPVEDELNDSRLFGIVSVIAVCLSVKSIIRYFRIRWLPEAAGCILVGAVGSLLLDFVPQSYFAFDEKLFLRVMLPPIIFEASLNIDKRAFLKHVLPITLYAGAGTLLSSVVTALVVHHATALSSSCATIPFVESLVFGALISSIDPVAVLSVLSNMGMATTEDLYVLVFGESLLNDGVALVLFETLVLFLDENVTLDTAAVIDAAMHFVVVAVGSVSVGVACGACCTAYFWAMYGCQSPLVEVLTFFCWALIPFYVCDGVGWSGIVALVAAGFVMDLFVVGSNCHLNNGSGHGSIVGDNGNSNGNTAASPIFDLPPNLLRTGLFRRTGHLSTTARSHVGFVTEINSTMMETAIFAYLGLFLFSSRYHWNATLSFIAVAACLLSRAIMIPLMSGWANRWTTARAVRRKQKRAAATAAAASHSNGHADKGALPGDVKGDTNGHHNHHHHHLVNGNGNGENSHSSGHSNNRRSDDDTESSSSAEEPPVHQIDRKLQIVLWFAGLRGAMSFALVENVPLFDRSTGHGSVFKSELKSMTCSSIVFTVFVLGGGTSYVMDWLGVRPKGKGVNGGDDANGDARRSVDEDDEHHDEDVEMIPLIGRQDNHDNGGGGSNDFIRHRVAGKDG